MQTDKYVLIFAFKINLNFQIVQGFKMYAQLSHWRELNFLNINAMNPFCWPYCLYREDASFKSTSTYFSLCKSLCVLFPPKKIPPFVQ